ncbi:MAG TPA: ABC transporter substrate-binding protein [Oscillospiraceae bacterium]|nr:ABC transporter substrate-binding protein [Oscillospiraceae bacterium]HPK36446.1 ABC transporter substrate-binding protein [Oscillospiraceae bacterium]HPR76369.1 ABC transporter substrate-binding protein [Oscillospiraceae bacterium]
MGLFLKRVCAILLTAVICLGLMSGCGSVLPKSAEIQTPLVVAYDPFNGNFNPFYADAANDHDVVGMTQINLMTTDRNGGVVYNAIEGETIPYNGTDYLYKGPADLSVTINDDGTTTYRAKIRDDLVFSDGVKLSADDLIFTYYVLCDPSYIGPSTFSSYNIVGLQNYQTQTTDAVYAEYAALAAEIFASGPDHIWADTDAWTQEQQDGFWAMLKQVWAADIQGFAGYFVSEYVGDYGEMILGKTPEEITANEGLKIAFATAALELGGIGENGIFGTISGKTFDINNGVYPTIEDLYNEIFAQFEGDPRGWMMATGSEIDILGTTAATFISKYGPLDESMNGQGVANITGIKKLDDNTVEVTTVDYEASAVYAIFDVFIAPLHYYGDKSLYDYAGNKFGFTFGDLSGVQAKTSAPVGAGAYKFVKYEDKVVYFEANGNYYKGCPKLQNIQFKEISEADKITSISSGTADIANPVGSKTNFEAIRQINNGELDGAVIITDSVDYLGYGYIGMNADTVNVGGDPSSEASKNLRKGLATLFSVYRDVAVNSFFGDSAAVINYPISNTSWAAPQKSDADYQTAFSKDIDGNGIYASGMDAEAKYAAALQAAIGFFKAAGFTFDETAGKFTAAPEGAKLSYEALIPANGVGIHPNFQVLSNTAAALETIGFTLNISDPPDSSVILSQLDAGTQEIWVSAWSASIDPDMYQIYHSSCIAGNGGSDTNYYHIDDPDLDQYLLDARSSADQAYRKATYKACLDIILDWAVEVPSYQRQNILIFSTERVNIDTITPDITTYWSWMNGIELLEVYEVK